ncbi:MAG: endonuclease domain-containing protein [Candidatus Binataceae bacterium]
MLTNKIQRAVPLSFHRARQLRREETDAERKLWAHLRTKRFEPIKFRRQLPIGDFIVDFCCKDRKLVIELDGGQHNEPAGIAKDMRRTEWLEKRGYRVMRFWNNEVLTNIDGVVEMILQALGRKSV